MMLGMLKCLYPLQARGGDKPKDSDTERKHKCNHCDKHGGENLYKCGGQGGGMKRCDYFDQDGKHRSHRCGHMKEKGKSDHNPYQCPAAKGNRDDCPFKD